MTLLPKLGSGDPSDSSSGPSGSNSHIREVWAQNLEEEMDRICDIADNYPYIAMVRITARFTRIYVLI